MTDLNKAAIEYDGALSPLRFHSVVTESHTATAEVTKFPVQSGAEVSNHVIRKNRTVSIEGVVSNHVIKGQGNEIDYGNSNQRTVFAELKRLVNEGVVCEVVTNLGKYTPVIWTKFETKTTAKNPFALHFTIKGEEVILAESLNRTSPVAVTLKSVSDASMPAAISSLESVGIDVPEGAELLEADVTIGESFSVETLNSAGKTMVMTYVLDSLDPTGEKYNYNIHTSDTEVFKKIASPILDFHALVSDATGASTISSCLLEGGAELIDEAVGDLIDTTVGKLTKSIYGAYYETFGVNGNENVGQIIASLGVDCLVLGALGDETSTTTTGIGAGIPSAASILSGAIRQGGKFGKKATSATKLIKVVFNGA